MARVTAGITLARPRRLLRVTTLVRIPPSRVRVRAVLGGILTVGGHCSFDLGKPVYQESIGSLQTTI